MALVNCTLCDIVGPSPRIRRPHLINGTEEVLVSLSVTTPKCFRGQRIQCRVVVCLPVDINTNDQRYEQHEEGRRVRFCLVRMWSIPRQGRLEVEAERRECMLRIQSALRCTIICNKDDVYA